MQMRCMYKRQKQQRLLTLFWFLAWMTTARAKGNTNETSTHRLNNARTMLPLNLQMLESFVNIWNAKQDANTGNSLVAANDCDIIDVFKRAPSGFVGMRGKKLLNKALNHKKSYAQAMNGLHDKKAPPVDSEGIQTNEAFSSNLATLWNKLLAEMDKKSLHDKYARYIFKSFTETDNELTKRAALGFADMRGKRFGQRHIIATETTFHPQTNINKNITSNIYKRLPMLFWNKSTISDRRHGFLYFGNKFVAVRGKKNFLDGTKPKEMVFIGQHEALNPPTYGNHGKVK